MKKPWTVELAHLLSHHRSTVDVSNCAGGEAFETPQRRSRRHTAFLSLSVEISRQPRSGGWRKVLKQLLGTGASGYFLRKLGDVLAKVTACCICHQPSAGLAIWPSWLHIRC